MKFTILRSAIIVLAIICIVNYSASAQLLQTNGPGGGGVNVLFFNSGTLFAGTLGGGIFLSTNNGSSWAAKNNGLTSKDVKAVAVLGTNLFVGTNGGGIFLSTNNGNSWSVANNGISNINGLTNYIISSFVVSGSNIFAGVDGGGVFLSSNNGTSWTLVNNGLPTSTIKSLTVIGSTIFVLTGYYNGTNGGVFLSTNNGTSWSSLNNGLSNLGNIRTLYTDGATLFATTFDGVYISNNNGSTWSFSSIGAGGSGSYVLAITKLGTNLFAGKENGVYISIDNGVNWTLASIGLTTFDVKALITVGTNLFASNWILGIYKSSNNGATWLPTNTGLANTIVNTLMPLGPTIFAGTMSGLFTTTTNGNNWAQLTIPLVGVSDYCQVKGLVTMNSKIYAGLYGNGVLVSSDNGNSWAPINNGFQNLWITSIASFGNFLFAGTNNSAFVSSDSGAIWTFMFNSNGAVTSFAQIGSNLFAGMDAIPGVYKSTNNGASWVAAGVGNGLFNGPIKCLHANGVTLFAGTVGGGVYLSNNNGSSWAAANIGMPANASVYSFTQTGSLIFAGTNAGVYVSSNNGNSWTLLNSTDLTNIVYSLATNASKLFAGTNLGGVFIDPTVICSANITPTGMVSFCAGSSITLNANTGSGITYQWYRNGSSISGATGSTYAANNSGTFYVREISTCGTANSNNVTVTQINNPDATISYTSPLAFCAPGSVLLTANTYSGVTYQWQKNGTDIAGATNQTYSATTNGTYRVRQMANGCSKYGVAVSTTTTTSVSVAITANGPVTFCTGGSVVLSVTGAVPGYSYQWKNNNVNIGGATTSSYTATAAGSFTCTVTANCGSATSNIIQVSTNGITATIVPSGSVTICNGGTAALSTNNGAGYTHQWFLNGNPINGATSSAYNATAAGSYTVAITSPCGNATAATTTVSIAAVTASITPSGTATICAGSAQTFTANTGYNYTYKWFRNGTEQVGATSSTYSNSSYGTYTVRITQGGTCSATSAGTQLIVTTNPTATITAGGPTTFCAGQSVTLTSSTFAGVGYQWQKNSTNIAGATNQTYAATTTGAYRVKQTANGCTLTSVSIAVTVNCRVAGVATSDEVNGDVVIKVMPNPFSDELTIYVGSASSPHGLQFNVGNRIQLINVIGEVVLTETVNGKQQTVNTKLKTGNIPKGIYFLQVTSSSEMKTVKVVKQ